MRWKTERADHRVKARAHGRVAHPELALHVFEVAAYLDERLKKLQLLRCEPVEPAESEGAFQARAAGRAFKARNVQRVGADGASRDHRIRHELKVRAGLIESQGKLSVM